MKKTYVTKMPDHIGAFLKASKCFSSLNVNITRVSYNKAVDSHTLFIDVEGEKENVEKANEYLKEIGYLQFGEENGKIVLLEFRLEDKPGSVTKVLELINSFNFNISYISSQENGTKYQYFKMGLYVADQNDLTNFLSQANQLCKVRIVDYDNTKKVYDNSIFYNSYVDGLVKTMALTGKEKEELLVNVNLAMQTLDERGLSPHTTFDSISKFTELLAESKGENYNPRITEYAVTENTKITVIEPNCGSNTTIIESAGERVFVDCGYACYKDEMMSVIKSIVPDFDKERIIVTHSDVDHTGLLNEFDEVIASQRTVNCLLSEGETGCGFRESNPLHKPYVNICKILTSYESVNAKKLKPLWNKSSLSVEIEQIGFFKVGELTFEVYEGKGGHLPGEIILIDYGHKIAFTGDVFINLKELTPKQAEYNKYAPILMISVDTDATLCAKERQCFLQRLGVGEWQIFSGHGPRKVYQTQNVK